MILLAVILAALVLGAWIISAQTVETASWGLSFRAEGAPPIGPANAATLSGFDAAYVGSSQEKKLYLTFDAGYENGCTGQILDILKKHNVPAAFFLWAITPCTIRICRKLKIWRLFGKNWRI